MCGIIGVFGYEDACERVKAGLHVIQDRGKDQYGLSDGKKVVVSSTIEGLTTLAGKNCIGHALHSLVSFVPQPLKGKGVLVSNNEIYNWKFLNQCFHAKAKNDSELLLHVVEKSFGSKKGMKYLAEQLYLLDGVYAFGYWNKDGVVLARDILGVKPLFYSLDGGFCFASEAKVLKQLGCKKVEELNPRSILVYDLKRKKAEFFQRKFFSIGHFKGKKLEDVRKTLKGLLVDAVAKRIPDQKFGILMSGGVDSTFIALVCKELGVDFTCYTACLKEPGLKESEDVEFAKRFCSLHHLPLKIAELSLDEVDETLKKVVPLIEDSNVVKAGVGLTFYAACALARKDGIKVIFSGLGSEEIFAGYERHTRALDINKECLHGLKMMYERDLYRDDVITMNQNIELRLPFLDKTLVEYSLKIPAEEKIKDGQNKVVFRDVAASLGLEKEFAFRKKRAAQYGSRFDKAIEKLSRRKKFMSKSGYLDSLFSSGNVKLCALLSSGKDSLYAMHVMKQQHYEIACGVSLRSKNPASYMFHTPNIDLVKMQAETMGLQLLLQETAGEKENELKDLEKVLVEAKKKFQVQGVVSGALYSRYQRDRIEKVCERLRLKVFTPLWHIDQREEMKEILRLGFTVVLSSVAGYGLDKKWLGRVLTMKDVEKLVELNRKYKINIAGEGGEFESLVLDCPLFMKKIEVLQSHIVEEDEHTAQFVVEKARLVKKDS